MELKYLQTFSAVAEEGSYSGAARKLNYTQSTITFQMNQLEKELSVQLFEKIGRKMVLTKAGECLIPYVEQVLGAVDRINCFESDLKEYKGDLRVGVGETLLCYKTSPAVREFCLRAPESRLFLRSMNCYDIREALMDGSLDLGVFYEDIGGLNAGITSYPIASTPLVLAASPQVKEQCPDFITPGQNLPVPFVINESACVFRQIFERYLQEKSIVLDYTVELWSIPTIKNLVKSGMGVTYLPRFAVEEELERGELAEIPTEVAHSRITAVCAHHKNKWVSPAMELFIRLMTGAEKTSQ